MGKRKSEADEKAVDGSSDADESERLRKALEESFARWHEAQEAESARSIAHFERFGLVLRSEDLTGMLVRGHLYAENEMARILSNAMPLYHKIEPRQLMFEVKVGLLRALGLISKDEKRALKKLGEVRNGLSHITKPGEVPELAQKQIQELADSLAETMKAIFDEIGPRENDADLLRNTILSIVITLYVRAEVTEGEFARADLTRYHLTGATVQQRIEKARVSSMSDPEDLAAVKRGILSLAYGKRGALRAWIGEVFHN